jgi:two-component sensor histidine kinase
VKAKFHPGDMAAMWGRVAKAFDPTGDGRYDVEYRVKNTFATIQAIAAHTLRSAKDLPSAREALEQRIVSMAKAHDLPTVHSWTGAKLADVVARALDAFSPGRVQASGDSGEINSRHTLALSLALHELATNATKYGALSRSEGRVAVEWKVGDGTLQIDWRESGGPAVAKPETTGFGSRLLRQLIRDLGGTIGFDYDRAGLRCRLRVPFSDCARAPSGAGRTRLGERDSLWPER